VVEEVRANLKAALKQLNTSGQKIAAVFSKATSTMQEREEAMRTLKTTRFYLEKTRLATDSLTTLHLNTVRAAALVCTPPPVDVDVDKCATHETMVC
jgi:hypothetical protein